MLHIIENKDLICTLESTGAEIRSLKNKATNEEYIWQIDNTIWGSSSPVLFPYIGNVKEGKVIFNGKEYSATKHGIIRNNNQLSFEQQESSVCSFSLTSSQETLKHYPFKFSFTVEYALIEKRLIMTYRIENRDSVPMSFVCGGHTAYSCPLSDKANLSDYVIEFPTLVNLDSLTLGASGLLTSRNRKIESCGNLLPLSDTLFDEDALIFPNIECYWVRLRKKSADKGIIVRFPDYPHLALWSKPSADYVCIEPWLGLPDREEESMDLSQKSTYKTIAPDTEFTIAIETEIEQLMTNKILTLEMPPAYTPEELTKVIQKQFGTKLPYRIAKQSLDCRKKSHIHWVVQIEILDNLHKNLSADDKPFFPKKVKNPKPVTVIGSGPAGIFCAIVLAEAGLPVTLLERGYPIDERREAISAFEQGKRFCEQGNYAFGEGGAGAFSDGKLTSRSKNISAERAFVHHAYIKAGAPKEIAYLAHPHVGSDILFAVTKSLRKRFQEAGGTTLFNSKAENFRQKDKQWLVDFSNGQLSSSYVVAAPGNSARDTLKTMIRSGIPFQPKSFALGMRAEHPQQLINQAQWGQAHLTGVKAAEYRLTAPAGVYSFCMCPGGRIIQAAPYDDVNIVNGMSLYERDGRWANAAVVATYNPVEDCQQNADALTALEWLTDLERKFKTNFNFQAPCISIQDFIQGKNTGLLPRESSYLLGTIPFDPWDYLPKTILPRLKDGLSDFCRKLKGYETGFLLGLESKTSSPIQALRDESGESLGCQGFYVVGEASGRAGGIVSSAADGIKAALSIIGKCN